MSTKKSVTNSSTTSKERRNRIEQPQVNCGTFKDPTKHRFSSGASSSENKVPTHQIYRGFIRRVANRFGIGQIKHSRGNYLTGILAHDVDFLRDRYDHAVDHLLSVKEEGSVPFHVDLDHFAAVGWFLSIAMEAEELYKINWQDLLKMRTPEDEKKWRAQL